MGALLERDPELDALTAAAADAARGSGVVVLVHGEPGIGKSSLVRTWLNRLPPETRTFVGACDDLITPRALGPFRDAVRWRGGPLADALEGDGDRTDVFDAVLTELSHPRDLTVLVVEDVHWADEATLDVLQFVVRRISGLRAMVVLTYRDDELRPGHPLQPLLAAAAGPAVRHIAVPRLSVSAVRSLSAESGHDADTVFAVTSGNAFFVTELVAAAGDNGVPATVVDAVLARVRLLDGGTQRALEQLSVIPTHVEHWLVEKLLGGLDCLADAEQRGMLRVDRERVAFRHELARRAIEQSLPASRRVALNRALVAALLAAPDADVSRVVHHAVEAGDVDTIVVHAPRAAREAARAGSHRQALAQFEEALRHEQRLPLEERARLLEEYAWELYNAHRFDHAAQAAQRAYELRRVLDDPVALGTSLVTLSRHRWMSGEADAAWSAIQTAVEVLDATDDVHARARAHTYRGAVLALRGQTDEALPQLAHALALAEASGADGLISLCLNYQGLCEMLAGDEETGVALQRQSLAHAKAVHEDRQNPARAFIGENLARAYTNLVNSLVQTGRTEELAALLPEALDYTRESGFTAHAYTIEAHRCAQLMRSGQWDEAEQSYRQLDRSVGDPGVLGRFMLPGFARLLARRGRSEAEEVLARAIRSTDATTIRGASADATIAYVEWAWLTGQPERAMPRLTAELQTLQPRDDRRQLGELLRYAKRAGIHDAKAFDECPEPWELGLRGDWFAAATAWQRLGNDYERALELAESGDVGVTTMAIGLLDSLGADAAAAIVRRRLRDLGAVRIPRGPQPATKANPAGLTDRQVDVLALLRAGLTNAEIADRLVLSVRTVDHHVAAILDKLQVPSRRSAASRAAELGIG